MNKINTKEKLVIRTPSVEAPKVRVPESEMNLSVSEHSKLMNESYDLMLKHANILQDLFNSDDELTSMEDLAHHKEMTEYYRSRFEFHKGKSKQNWKNAKVTARNKSNNSPNYVLKSKRVTELNEKLRERRVQRKVQGRLVK